MRSKLLASNLYYKLIYNMYGNYIPDCSESER